MLHIKSILISTLILSFMFCNAQKSPCPQPTDSLFLSYYQKKAQKKVDDLGSMLQLIVRKDTDPIDVNTLIDNAVELFVNEDAQVQVSNIRNTNNPNSPIKIRDYLNKLKLLKYDKVEIRWTSIQYISPLRLADDGCYHGVISFEQEFERTRDGRIIYSDLTRKNVLVILKPQQVPIDGVTYSCWDVFLSDIKVTETRQLK